MCFGGKQASTQQTTPNPQALANYQTAVGMAANAAQTPFQTYSGQFVAPVNSTQQQGISAIGATQGMANPYYQQAGGMTLSGAGSVNADQFTPENLSRYMNPYENQVINPVMEQLRQQQGIDRSSLQGNQIMEGAFGGDRAGLSMGNLEKQQEMASSQTLGGMLNNMYGQGVQEFNTQQQTNLSAEQANQQRQLAAAQQYAGLGASQQQAALQGSEALLNAGTLQQQTQQQQDTALYNQFLAQQAYPFQTANFYAGIAEGTGGLMGNTVTSKTPAPFFSDEKTKENIKQIGELFDGQKIYKFNYKGDDRTVFGLLAGEVEKKHPDAVGESQGLKTVDYDKASKNAAQRGHFASGGISDLPFGSSSSSYVPASTHGGGSSVLQPGHLQPQATPSIMSQIATGINDVDVLGKGYDKAKTGLSNLMPPKVEDGGAFYRGGRAHYDDGGTIEQPITIEEPKDETGPYKPKDASYVPDGSNQQHGVLQPGGASGGQQQSGLSQLAGGASALGTIGKGIMGIASLFKDGGSVRHHYDDGGTVDQPDSTNQPTPDPNASAFGTFSPPSDMSPYQVAKSNFMNNLQANEGGAKGQKSATSSAIGPFQFTSGTWHDLITSHPELHMTDDDRLDPTKQQAALSTHTDDLASALQHKGVDVTPGNLYAGHFMGKSGGPSFVAAANQNPDAPAYTLVNDAAVKANHNMFFNKDGTPKTAGELVGSFETKLGKGSPIPPSPIPNPSQTGSDYALSGVSALNNPTGLSAPGLASLPPTPQEQDSGGLLSIGKNGLSPTQQGLLKGVFGMLGSKNHTFLGSLGEGGVQGMDTYGNAQQREANLQAQQNEMAYRNATLGMTAQQRQLELQKLGFEQSQQSIRLLQDYQKSFQPRLVNGKLMYFNQNTKETVSPDQVKDKISGYAQQIGAAGGRLPTGAFVPIAASGQPVAPTSSGQAPQASQAPTTPVSTSTTTPSPQSSRPPDKLTPGSDIGKDINNKVQQQSQNLFSKSRDSDNPTKIGDRISSLQSEQKLISDTPDFADKDKEIAARQTMIEHLQKHKEAIETGQIPIQDQTTGNPIYIPDVMKQQRDIQTQKTLAEEDAKFHGRSMDQRATDNKEILKKNGEAADVASNMIAAANLGTSFLKDAKGNYNVNAGAWGEHIGDISKSLQTLGVPDDKIKALTGTDPNNYAGLQKALRELQPSIIRENLPGQRITQQEFQKLGEATPTADVPAKMLDILLNQMVVPKAQHQLDLYGHLLSKDASTDNLRKEEFAFQNGKNTSLDSYYARQPALRDTYKTNMHYVDANQPNQGQEAPTPPNRSSNPAPAQPAAPTTPTAPLPAQYDKSIYDKVFVGKDGQSYRFIGPGKMKRIEAPPPISEMAGRD